MRSGILISLLVIGTVAMVAGAGTLAYFSDTETSTGNTFTAGTLNLQVGDADPTDEKISISDLKPGDSGNAADWTVTNTGSITGFLSISISSITNNENGLTDPEQEAGDTTSNEGELGSYLKVSIWLDMDQDGAWDSGDIALKSDGSIVTYEESQEKPYDYLNSYGGKSWGITSMASGDAFDFMVDYEFPPADNDDTTQSDSAVFDITFSLEQTIPI